MSDEQLEKLYESMSDDDLTSFWNHSGITDDLGELEEELMSRGFEDLWRPTASSASRNAPSTLSAMSTNGAKGRAGSTASKEPQRTSASLA